MSPENNRDSVRFKLPHFRICLHQGGSLKKPYCRTECVDVAKSDVIGYVRGGATAKLNICDFCRAQ